MVLVVKDPLANAGDLRGVGPNTLVFLPGEFHGQRSLTGYGPRGHTESDMTEVTQLSKARRGV